MAPYELYLFLHVGAASVWVGSAFAIAILETRASFAGGARRVVALAREAAILGPLLYLPANLLVLVSAFLMVDTGNWGYRTLWIQLGFLGFCFSFLMGVLFFGLGWSETGKLVETDGVDSPRVHAWIRLMLVGSWIDLGVLFAVMFVMTTKPTGGESGVLAVAAAIVVVCAAFPFALLRAQRGEPRAEKSVETPLPGG
jgi:hypothetical protein